MSRPPLLCALLLFVAMLAWSGMAHAGTASPAPSCTPPRGMDPADLPPAPSEPAEMGVVRLDSPPKAIVVDGWSCPLRDGAIEVTCGRHEIARKVRGSKKEPIQIVNVPCGGAVVLGQRQDDPKSVAGGILLTVLSGLTLVVAAAVADASLCDDGWFCNRRRGTTAIVVAIAAGGGVAGGIALIVSGGRTVPTAKTVPLTPTGPGSARITVGDRSVGIGFSF